MSKSAEWKERRAKYAPERMRNAKERLRAVGIQVTQIDQYTLSFYFHCAKILYFPYTGGVIGATVKSTRGIDALIEQVKNK